MPADFIADESIDAQPSSRASGAKSRARMSTRNRLLFFLTAWLICLMPFLFWWNTWFGRQLSDRQLTEYLHDEKKPRHMQQALVQIGERINRHDASAATWYPEVVRLSSGPVEEVRNTGAWVMGQDNAATSFHDALLKMLGDPSPMVRGNAALSLVRFGDATGRPQIVALLQPARLTAPGAGHVMDSDRAGTAIHQGGLIAQLKLSDSPQPGQPAQTIEIRTPIPGRIRSVAQTGAKLAADAEIAVIDPGSDQIWEALRALFLVGQIDDIPAILPYERDLPEISDRVRQQAALTEKAIRERAK